jgi:hypothetical protein
VYFEGYIYVMAMNIPPRKEDNFFSYPLRMGRKSYYLIYYLLVGVRSLPLNQEVGVRTVPLLHLMIFIHLIRFMMAFASCIRMGKPHVGEDIPKE